MRGELAVEEARICRKADDVMMMMIMMMMMTKKTTRMSINQSRQPVLDIYSDLLCERR